MRRTYGTRNFENKVVTMLLFVVAFTIGLLKTSDPIQVTLPAPEPQKTVTFVVEIGPLGGRTTRTPTEAIPVSTNTVNITRTVSQTDTLTVQPMPTVLDTQHDLAVFKKYLSLSDHTIVWLVFVKWAYDNNLWPTNYVSGQTQSVNCLETKNNPSRPWDKTATQLKFLINLCRAHGVEF